MLYKIGAYLMSVWYISMGYRLYCFMAKFQVFLVLHKLQSVLESQVGVSLGEELIFAPMGQLYPRGCILMCPNSKPQLRAEPRLQSKTLSPQSTQLRHFAFLAGLLLIQINLVPILPQAYKAIINEYSRKPKQR